MNEQGIKVLARPILVLTCFPIKHIVSKKSIKSRCGSDKKMCRFHLSCGTYFSNSLNERRESETYEKT